MAWSLVVVTERAWDDIRWCGLHVVIPSPCTVAASTGRPMLTGEDCPCRANRLSGHRQNVDTALLTILAVDAMSGWQ